TISTRPGGVAVVGVWSAIDPVSLRAGGIPSSLSARRENFIKSSNITIRPPSPLCPTPGRRHRLSSSVQQAPPGTFTACTAYPGRVEGHRPRLWDGVPVVTQPTEFTPFSPCYKAVSRVFDF